MYFDAEFPEELHKYRTTVAPRTATRATLKGIPSGREGMIATLFHMRDFVRESIRSPAQTVRLKALELVRHLPPRAWRGQYTALQKFVQEKIRYVPDPEGLESVQSPEKTLELGQGDCDDQATLLSALLKSLAHPSQFMAIGRHGGPFRHVLVQTLDGNQWVTLETIYPKPAGWFPQGVTSRYILRV